ncbi:TPA: hypothetical protein QIY66_003960 [Raoultella planticola]|uniref:hypothetical protein n=1 Tax=Raoultella planticola TaxID=575 RepID=UPI000BA13B79|nr:hypothetical protein [Raoultella planticola]OZP75768.1 hypothetical protein CIG23_02845 [Raoultella planticola]HDT5960559.1 hypothetical protein [Citrobacter freundii]HDV8889853.1 hypothetical protein [Raoultella planticola]HDV9489227.1 hypothetical protein [Citrobacter freundii]
MNDSRDIVSIIGDKAERAGFARLSMQQQAQWLLEAATDREAAEISSFIMMAASHDRAWYSPFGIIELQTIAGDDQISFLSQVHEAESYLDRLLSSRESPGKVMDGYLILDITHLPPELRDFALQMEQNTLMVRKHCIWDVGNWQRVDRISILALSIENLYMTNEYPPDLDEAGQQLVEELGLGTPNKVATMHAAEWDDSHE